MKRKTTGNPTPIDPSDNELERLAVDLDLSIGYS